MWMIEDHFSLKATSSGRQREVEIRRGQRKVASRPFREDVISVAAEVADFGLGSVCVLDRYPDALRLYLARRDADLEDSSVVAGGDILGVHPGGQPDQPGERAVTEL